MPAVPVQEICPVILRYAFNGGQYHQRSERSELLRTDGTRQRPAPVAMNEPAGTLSGIFEYRLQDGTLVARAHRYLRSDGSLGGSGRPDPKWLLAGEVALVVPPSDVAHLCDACRLGNLGPPSA